MAKKLTNTSWAKKKNRLLLELFLYTRPILSQGIKNGFSIGLISALCMQAVQGTPVVGSQLKNTAVVRQTFSGISGSSNLSILGKWLLGQSGTYSGALTIGDGTEISSLGVLGNIGSVTVTSNSELFGSGTINGDLANQGLVSPSLDRTVPSDGSLSTPVGTTLTVNGAYTADTGETHFYVTPTAADKMAVAGTANISGLISLNFEQGDYANFPTTTLLQASTLSGSGVTTLLNTQSSVQITHPTGTYYPNDTESALSVTPDSTTSPTKINLSYLGKIVTLGNGSSVNVNYNASTLQNNPNLEYKTYNSPIINIDSNSNSVSPIGVSEADTLTITNSGAHSLNCSALYLNNSSVLDLSTSSGNKVITNNFVAANNVMMRVLITPSIPDSAVTAGSAGSVSEILVNGTATIGSSFTAALTLAAGIYRKGVTDYEIINTAGGISVVSSQNVAADLTLNAPSHEGITFSMNITPDGKKIFIQTVVAQDLTLTADVLPSGTSLPGSISDEGGSDSIVGSSLPVSTDTSHDSAVMTSLVFQSNTFLTSAANTDAFRFTSSRVSIRDKQVSNRSALESILQATAAAGPVAIERNETRVWISPYATRNRLNTTATQVGNQGWSGGALVGLERRDAKNIWTWGLLTGVSLTTGRQIGDPQSFTKSTAFTLGVYNTLKYTDYKDTGNFGHEILLARTQGYNKMQQNIVAQSILATSSNKDINNLANAQFNYLFNILAKKITCRLSIGGTYTETSSTGYNLRTNAFSQTVSATRGRSSEVYFGPGLRYIWDNKETVVRVTGVYEYGVTTMNVSSARGGQVLVGSNMQTFAEAPGSAVNKHYIQLNGSYLNRKSGLKFILAYAGTLYKDTQNHTFMGKFEYRF